jgi:hypothetical protein
MLCQVETYSGSRLHERPRRFSWGGAWLEVQEVLRQWSEPEHLHFKVAAADGRIYLLTYCRPAEAWEVRPLGRPE